jgi:hypothetical protein
MGDAGSCLAGEKPQLRPKKEVHLSKLRREGGDESPQSEAEKEKELAATPNLQPTTEPVSVAPNDKDLGARFSAH